MLVGCFTCVCSGIISMNTFREIKIWALKNLTIDKLPRKAWCRKSISSAENLSWFLILNNLNLCIWYFNIFWWEFNLKLGQAFNPLAVRCLWACTVRCALAWVVCIVILMVQHSRWPVLHVEPECWSCWFCLVSRQVWWYSVWGDGVQMAGVLDEGSIPVPSNMASGRAFNLAGELDMLGSD